MLGRFQACAALRRFAAGPSRQAHGNLRLSRQSTTVVKQTRSKLQQTARSNATATAPNAQVVKVAQNLDSVAQVVAYTNVWGAIRTFPKRKPFLFNLFLSGTMMPLADWFVQRSEGGKWEWRRSMFFCVFGLYNGTAWWFVYINCFNRFFPQAIRFSNLSWAAKLTDRVGQKQLLGQVLADLVLYVPFVYFPVFYLFKANLQGDHPVMAVRRWMNNFIEDNIVSVGFWMPGDMLCFAAPAWLRLPLSHGVSFSWNILLSWYRGCWGT